ncbi:MAG: hypothetical protein ACKV2T_26660 [Kofleriaceae bacterium]
MGRITVAFGAVAVWIALAATAIALPAEGGRSATDALAEHRFRELVANVDTLAKEIAKLRGLRLKKPVAKEVVTAPFMSDRLAVLANEPKTLRMTAAEDFGYSRWGLIAPDTNYAQLLLDLRRDQVLGYYDPDTRRLTMVIHPALRDNAELVLAHEIQHALQDQNFDLKKFEDLPETEGDARRARRALVEGDALATMVELMLKRRGSIAPWSDPDVTTALEKSMSLPGSGTLDLAPLAVREAMMFPYQAGLAFVAALRRRQPWSAVDAAFAKPPRSTEQILHPERYQAGDHPIPVDIAPPSSLATWSLGQSTVWGELGFVLFLRSHGVDSAQAAIAGEGWGGDRVLSMIRPNDVRPERGLGIARFEWDSEPDAIEAAEALEKAFDNMIAGGTIEHTHGRTRWLGVDGTISWIERKGPSVIMVLGAPAWMAGVDVWTASTTRKR